MACNCGGGGRATARTLYQLTTADGKIKKYATEIEASKAQKRLGGAVKAVKA